MNAETATIRYMIDEVSAAIGLLHRAPRVTFELQSVASVVKLTPVHEEFESSSAALETTRHSWPAIMSSLKSLLETGRPLPFQGLGFGPTRKEAGSR